MEISSFQGLFCAGQPYCLQIKITAHTEPLSVQLDWRSDRNKARQLCLSFGKTCHRLDDGDVTVFRLTDTQWQAMVENRASAEPEQWARQPFTLSELAVHPEFATFTAINTPETQVCRK
ncbi:hypothetical protein [Xenorhabdus miraniensis]|uniref:Uncharacterized protein n=1 Tax=Xenorhabdus miraniensis TaxID=351674 RepID=A0A2D0JKB8_9GAMM|nr:hypothetical protein [Xenorhabdus miraniensis]PHM46589.1 hypothetical protein Xmir_04097 [Xenorhabdus miraniensis]